MGIIGLISLIEGLSGFILLPILTRNISIEDYGIWVQINLALALLPAIATLGLPYTMVRFLAAISNREEIKEKFYSIVFTGLFSGMIASFVLFLFAEPIAEKIFNGNLTIIRLLSIIILIECLNSLFVAFFRTFQQTGKYLLFSLISISINASLVAYFILSFHNIIYAEVGLCISRLIVLLITAYLIISEIGIKIPNFRSINKFLTFGIPFAIQNLFGWIITSSDRFVIGIILGTAFVGYYSPGYALGNIIGIFITPLGFLLPAVLSKLYDKNDLYEAKIVFRYTLKYYLLLVIPCAFGLSLLSENILVLISTQEIAVKGHLITPIIALSAVIYGINVLFSHILLLEKKTKIIGITWVIAAILSLVLNLLVVSNIGIFGAAITALITYTFIFISTLHYSIKSPVVDLDLISIFKSIFASILMSTVIYYCKPNSPLDILTVIAGSAIVYVATLVLLRAANNNEVHFFKHLLGI